MAVYQTIEARVLSVIYETFLGSDLTEKESRTVKEIDDAMLSYDLEYLLGEEKTDCLFMNDGQSACCFYFHRDTGISNRL